MGIRISPLLRMVSNSYIERSQLRAFCSLKDDPKKKGCELEKQDLIDVLDENGIRTGEVLPRKQIHTFGKIHRAVHLYLFDESNNLLLQKRSSQVDHCPDMYSISLTGHIDAGEASSFAVYRELQEELGLDSSKMGIHFLFSYRQDVEINPSYIDRQFNDVYVCWHKFSVNEIHFSKKEISDLKLVPFSIFKSMVFSQNSELAPFYRKECVEIVNFLSSRKFY